MDRILAVPKVIAVLVVAALLVAVTVAFWPGTDKRFVTAYFSRTISLYEGSDVKVLGVPVGRVQTVDPLGTKVRVKMWIEEDVKIPADAKAVIITPAVVGDRFVQFAPAYTGGPVLADGAVLEQDQTRTPLELDEIYRSIDDLSRGLGPEGANKDGSLSRLLDATAKNVDGQGAQINQTITDVGKLTGTLDNNKEELFASLEQLARFTATLKANDADIKAFNKDLARLSQFLEGERGDLAQALETLSVAMREVSRFVRENRDLVRKDVEGLTQISQVLVKQRKALEESLDVAPLALSNLALAYNPNTGTLDQRTNVSANESQLANDPDVFLCALVNQADNSKKACDAIKDAIGGLEGLQRSTPFRERAAQQEPIEIEHVDPSLAGLAGEGAR
jgi:phospholipid/cholesterol/gamma-HCH transport system substrate-binding protein